MYPGVRSYPFWDDRVRGLGPGDFSSPQPIRQTIRSQLTLSALRQTPIFVTARPKWGILPSSADATTADLPAETGDPRRLRLDPT